jgi:hypothetical protein
MSYIARVTGTPGNYTVVDFMEASLSDVSTGQGWVPVTQTWPTVDNNTQVQAVAVLTPAANGQSVSWTLNVYPENPLVAKENLRQYAVSQSIAKANGGVKLPSGAKLGTDPATSGEIVDAIEAIERGWASEPYTIQTLNGAWVSLSKADLLAAGGAITQFRLANYSARKACLDAINAGTITTSAQVLAAI